MVPVGVRERIRWIVLEFEPGQLRLGSRLGSLLYVVLFAEYSSVFYHMPI